ncbi:hypothetical protein CBR_g30631 [Chara braunii]|uniref:CCHC-type domain-containing protein n=1 Tax=Chara braunii TaxID=69332 RepID=A0A388LD74_CHABU|nr:hypothetical protein CBR_g30631 [Chara braunii]|eukprot:GBG80265.1 hypothetical protein CBR_g30631 [Chara braunii]
MTDNFVPYGACFNCKQQGHWARNCPYPRRDEGLITGRPISGPTYGACSSRGQPLLVAPTTIPPQYAPSAPPLPMYVPSAPPLPTPTAPVPPSSLPPSPPLPPPPLAVPTHNVTHDASMSTTLVPYQPRQAATYQNAPSWNNWNPRAREGELLALVREIAYDNRELRETRRLESERKAREEQERMAKEAEAKKAEEEAKKEADKEARLAKMMNERLGKMEKKREEDNKKIWEKLGKAKKQRRVTRLAEKRRREDRRK